MGHGYSIRQFFITLFMHKGTDEHDEEVNSKKYRNYHLVVATLIAAVTFQAGVNPPGGFRSEDSSSTDPVKDPTAFYVFLAFDTLAFSSSMLLIICLTWGFPFFLEVIIALVSMGITYGAAIFAITPSDMKFQSLLSIAAVPAIVRGVILICKYVNSKMSEENRKNHA